MRYDPWHGSEDYPYRPPMQSPDRKTIRDIESAFGPPWNWWDTFMRRMLMAGGVCLVWAMLAVLIIAVLKGDVG